MKQNINFEPITVNTVIPQTPCFFIPSELFSDNKYAAYSIETSYIFYLTYKKEK